MFLSRPLQVCWITLVLPQSLVRSFWWALCRDWPFEVLRLMLVFLLMIPFTELSTARACLWDWFSANECLAPALTDAMCSDNRYVRPLFVITRPSCFNDLDLKSRKSKDARNWTQMLTGVCVTEFQGIWGLHRKTRVTAQGRLGLFTPVEDWMQICTIPLQLLTSIYQE